MTTNPVMSITDEQIAEIQKEFNRNSPCPHYSTESLGFGHFHRCYDCGRDVPSDMLESSRQASAKHDSLSALLAHAFSHLRAAEKGAERYRALQKMTPYRFKKIQDACITDGGDVLYFHADRFDTLIDATMEQSK